MKKQRAVYSYMWLWASSCTRLTFSFRNGVCRSLYDPEWDIIDPQDFAGFHHPGTFYPDPAPVRSRIKGTVEALVLIDLQASGLRVGADINVFAADHQVSVKPLPSQAFSSDPGSLRGNGESFPEVFQRKAGRGKVIAGGSLLCLRCMPGAGPRSLAWNSCWCARPLTRQSG